MIFREPAARWLPQLFLAGVKTMRWRNRESSDNIEDRRGQSGAGGGLPPIGGKGGILLLVVVLVAGYYGIDLTPLLNGAAPTQTTSSAPAANYQPTAEEKELADFTGVALKTTEDTWGEIFQKAGSRYTPPKLVLYTGSTPTACGYGQSAMGPFYCPADQKVYIDLSFYEDMKKKLGGGGDFALGYVLAHEVGHHVQNLLGISEKAQKLESQGSKADANRISVKVELQADCFAGVWGNYMKRDGVLESGDLEKALNTPPLSVTTVCRKKRPGGLCLTASRTGLQPSAFTGSSAAITPGTRIPAIPLSLTPQTARYPLPPGDGPRSNPGLLQTKTA